MGTEKNSIRKSVQPIKLRFKSTGVKAGTAKCFHVLSTAAANDTRLMKMMYGNMQRVRNTARSKVSGLLLKPEAMSQTTTGAKATPKILAANTAQPKSEKTSLTNFCCS